MPPNPVLYECKRGDTWWCPQAFPFTAGGNTFDLTDSRWEVAGQIRLTAAQDEISGVLDFDEDLLANGELALDVAEVDGVLLCMLCQPCSECGEVGACDPYGPPVGDGSSPTCVNRRRGV